MFHNTALVFGTPASLNIKAGVLGNNSPGNVGTDPMRGETEQNQQQPSHPLPPQTHRCASNFNQIS